MSERSYDGCFPFYFQCTPAALVYIDNVHRNISTDTYDLVKYAGELAAKRGGRRVTVNDLKKSYLDLNRPYGYSEEGE